MAYKVGDRVKLKATEGNHPEYAEGAMGVIIRVSTLADVRWPYDVRLDKYDYGKLSYNEACHPCSHSEIELI